MLYKSALISLRISGALVSRSRVFTYIKKSYTTHCIIGLFNFQVTFNSTYVLTLGRFMQRYNSSMQNKDLRLRYEDGQEQDVSLNT